MRPGTDWGVWIRGAGPNGGNGYADLVYYDERTGVSQVWEIKPDRARWVDGAGQAQLQRYLDNLANSEAGPAYDEFVVPASFDENLELVVTSHGQKGMLYYRWRKRDRDRPRVWPPLPVPTGKPSNERTNGPARR